MPGMRSVRSDRAGYSLVEVLVSLLIMMIILLGLLESMRLYVRHNVKNTLRNEAIRIAQGCADLLRNQRPCNDVVRNFRNFQVRFRVSAVTTPLSSNLNNATITVEYDYGSTHYTYTLRTVIKR